jgi:SnoaL-like domain
VRQFFAAAHAGDLTGLEALLARDVVLTGDGGGKVPALARSLRGRGRVARTLLDWLKRLERIRVSMRLVEVNAGPGALALDEQGRLIAVWALEIAGGKIQSLRSIVNPDKLAHLGPTGDFNALLAYDFQQTGPGGRGPSRQ